MALSLKISSFPAAVLLSEWPGLVETVVTLEADLGAAFERRIDVLPWRLMVWLLFSVLQIDNERHLKRKDKVSLHV